MALCWPCSTQGTALAPPARGSDPREGSPAVPGDVQGWEQARGSSLPALPAQGQRPGRAASCQGLAPCSGGSAPGLFLEQKNTLRTLSPDPQQEPGQQGMAGTWPGWHQLEGAAGKAPGEQEGSCSQSSPLTMALHANLPIPAAGTELPAPAFCQNKGGRTANTRVPQHCQCNSAPRLGSTRAWGPSGPEERQKHPCEQSRT